MTDFDPTIPHDLSLVQFRDPHQSLGMTYSASLGGAYSAGTVSGLITRLQLMPGGYVVASVRRTQGAPDDIGSEVRVVFGGWIDAEFVPAAKAVREEKGPTAAQERARERAAKAVQA
jgi:hypothetical protein